LSLIFGSAAPARAASIALALIDSLGNSSGVIIDGGAGDLNPADGAVQFDGTIGDWAVNSTLGLASSGAMTLNSINASALTTSTLFVLFTSLDNTYIGDFGLSFDAAIQNGSVSYGAFGDPGNVGFNQSLGIGAIGPFVGGGSLALFSGQTLGAGPATAPYSLTQLFVVTGSGAEITIFGGQAQLQPVPEPGSLLLLASGLAAVGCVWRRRTRRG
jgi:hypothetical protein